MTAWTNSFHYNLLFNQYLYNFMKFGICIPNFGDFANKNTIDGIINASEKYEYDSIWTTDHIIVPEKEKIYTNTYETLITLAYIASKTENIAIGTSILVLPLREPFLVAKQLATLDELSNGRLIVGIGIGWLEEEFIVLNKDFKNRSKITDENIQLIKKLWANEIHTFKTPKGNVNFIFKPLPKQKYPKILIGGNSKRAIKRAALLGDGWYPVGLHYEDIKKGKEEIKKFSTEKKHIFLRISVIPEGKKYTYISPTGEKRYAIAGTQREITEDLENYKNAGVEHITCYFGNVNKEIYIERMKKFKEIITSFK